MTEKWTKQLEKNAIQIMRFKKNLSLTTKLNLASSKFFLPVFDFKCVSKANYCFQVETFNISRNLTIQCLLSTC